MIDTEVLSFYLAEQVYGKGLKRKCQVEERIESEEEDHAVPQWSKRRRTELPFSSLLKRMAAKHQNPKEELEPINPVISTVSPMSNPFSRLMAHMANISHTQEFSSEPLDLSCNNSEQEVNVDTVDDEEVKKSSLDIFHAQKIFCTPLLHLNPYLGVNLGQTLEISRRRSK